MQTYKNSINKVISMKKTLPLKFASALLLAVVTSSTLAATATVVTEVNVLFEPNGQTTMLGCGNGVDCDKDTVLDAPLLVTDPDGVSASSSLNFAFFGSTNNSGVPNFLHTGSALAHALPGSLHAAAEVQLTGTGGGGSTPRPGVTAIGYVEVRDQIKVNSSTLPDRTVVTLNVLMEITGQGRGQVGVTVRGRKAGISGLAGLFGDDQIAGDEDESLQGISGQFTAEVGSTLTIDYFLRSSTGVPTAGWGAADRLNGRARNSDYGNSAYLYFSVADPQNVSLEGLGGYDYVQPNPVPLPATFWLLLPGLGVLSRRRREANGAVNTRP